MIYLIGCKWMSAQTDFIVFKKPYPICAIENNEIQTFIDFYKFISERTFLSSDDNLCFVRKSLVELFMHTLLHISASDETTRFSRLFFSPDLLLLFSEFTILEKSKLKSQFCSNLDTIWNLRKTITKITSALKTSHLLHHSLLLANYPRTTLTI